MYAAHGSFGVLTCNSVISSDYYTHFVRLNDKPTWVYHKYLYNNIAEPF